MIPIYKMGIKTRAYQRTCIQCMKCFGPDVVLATAAVSVGKSPRAGVLTLYLGKYYLDSRTSVPFSPLIAKHYLPARK